MPATLLLLAGFWLSRPDVRVFAGFFWGLIGLLWLFLVVRRRRPIDQRRSDSDQSVHRSLRSSSSVLVGIGLGILAIEVLCLWGLVKLRASIPMSKTDGIFGVGALLFLLAGLAAGVSSGLAVSYMLFSKKKAYWPAVALAALSVVALAVGLLVLVQMIF